MQDSRTLSGFAARHKNPQSTGGTRPHAMGRAATDPLGHCGRPVEPIATGGSESGS